MPIHFCYRRSSSEVTGRLLELIITDTGRDLRAFAAEHLMPPHYHYRERLGLYA